MDLDINSSKEEIVAYCVECLSDPLKHLGCLYTPEKEEEFLRVYDSIDAPLKALRGLFVRLRGCSEGYEG